MESGKIIVMYIERVPNRNSPPAVLLRESYREGNRVKKRTIANLSSLPDDVIDNLKLALKGGKTIENIESAIELERSLAHGQIAAVLGTLKKVGLDKLLGNDNPHLISIVISLIVSRIINPCSKLATSRNLKAQTANSSLGKIMGLENVKEDDLYQALDWLAENQERIENQLAQKHIKSGSLVLYDLTSTYLEGEACPLGKYGYSRDRKKGYTQIVFGLLCDEKGCPIAVEVFSGNTNDASTITQQIEKVRNRFGIESVTWVGDKGMITNTTINRDLKEVEGLDWITTLRKSQIRTLVEAQEIQLGLFDEKNLVEISSAEYPGERLMVCRNPLLAKKLKQQREELIAATKKELEPIALATQRRTRPLRGAGKIGMKVGKVINKYKVGKYFETEITEDSFTYRVKESLIKEETVMDGLYVIRTSVKSDKMSPLETVKSYKSLSKVEQAFRCCKSIDLKVRPIYHYAERRVRAHIFLCMLAYYVEWEMRQKLAPMLFAEEEEETVLTEEKVLRYQPSEKARRKSSKKKNDLEEPVHSFPTLLDDLGTICLNTVEAVVAGKKIMFEKITRPTSLQQKALDLLGVSLMCTQ